MNDIYKMSYDFSLRVIMVYKQLTIQNREYILSKQILRSGTSIGANISEAKYAQSRKDFIHKMSIALKEASETEYWIRLLMDSEYLDKDVGITLLSKCNELIYILIAIIKTSTKNQKKWFVLKFWYSLKQLKPRTKKDPQRSATLNKKN